MTSADPGEAVLAVLTAAALTPGNLTAKYTTSDLLYSKVDKSDSSFNQVNFRVNYVKSQS